MIEPPRSSIDKASASPFNAERVWKNGTLTYTKGGLIALFSWLLWGDFAMSVRDRAIQATVQLLFKKYGASDMLTGLLLSSIPSAFGLFIGPVVGYKSDRLRTRWGRRIPFLIITTPFMALGLVGLGLCAQMGGGLDHFLGRYSPGLATSVLILLGISWIVFEIAIVTAGSVFGALINDVVPHELLGRFYGFFRAVSLIVGMVFFSWLMGKVETYSTAIFLVTALIYGFGFTLMCVNVREGTYPPIHDAAEGKGTFAAIITYFKDGYGNPFYLWFFAAGLLGGLATGPVNLYSVFYAKSLSMDMQIYGYWIARTYLTSLCLSYPLGWLADRFHPLRMSIYVMSAYSVAMAISFIFVHDAQTFGVALYVHGVIAGTYGTAGASLGQRLLPRDKFAEICSAGGIIGSVVGIFFAPTIGALLDYSGHNYRYTFLGGNLISAASLIPFYVLYRKFLARESSREAVQP